MKIRYRSTGSILAFANEHAVQPSTLTHYILPLNGEYFTNWNTIGISGKNPNISSAMAFHLYSYIILYSKQVLYLAILKFIYEVLMKSKCQIVKSGSRCSFGLHLIFLSTSFHLFSFSPSTLLKYIDTIYNFGKLKIFIASHTKPSQALQVLQESYMDVYNWAFICFSSFT